jgi:hypothetical protein
VTSSKLITSANTLFPRKVAFATAKEHEFGREDVIQLSTESSDSGRGDNEEVSKVN